MFFILKKSINLIIIQKETQQILKAYEKKVKLATVVEGDQKASFSIATTRGVGEGTTPFPGLHHFTLDTYLILQGVQQGGNK